MNKDEILGPVLQAINDLRDEVRENKMLWREYRKNRETDKKELFDILLKYDISISTQLGDKNAQKMKKILKI